MGSSTEMQKRKDITFERKIQRKVTEAQKDLKGLNKVEFACEEDARASLERRKEENPYRFLETMEISTISKRVVSVSN